MSTPYRLFIAGSRQATTDPLPQNAAFSRAHDVLAAIQAQQKQLESETAR